MQLHILMILILLIKKKILIFDIRRENFNISILKIKNNVYTVLTSCRDSHLCGEYFDNRIIEYAIGKIKEDQKFKDLEQ